MKSFGPEISLLFAFLKTTLGNKKKYKWNEEVFHFGLSPITMFLFGKTHNVRLS